MTEMNKFHLLWWVLTALDKSEEVQPLIRDVLLDPETWHKLDAPAWVLPTLRQKFQEL